MLLYPCQQGHSCIYGKDAGSAIYCSRQPCEFRGYETTVAVSDDDEYMRDPKSFKDWDILMRLRPNR
jgi:hypothetical protein